MTSPYEIAEAPRTTEEISAVAKALNIRMGDLLVLSQNNDPFQSDTPTKRREAEWFAGIFRQFGFSKGLHIRRVHYRAYLSREAFMSNGELYVNTTKCWDALCDASRYARDLGLVDASLFEDRRNDPIRRYARARRGGVPEPEGSIELPSYRPAWELPMPSEWQRPYFGLPYLRPLGVQYMDEHEADLGDVAVTGYDYDPGDQPYYEGLWIEKSTMNDVLDPLCAQLGLDFLVNKGFGSKSQAVELLVSARAAGKPLRVFMVSDYDPAGAHMPVSMARQMDYYRAIFAPETEVAVRHLGMRREWVDKYDLPRAPIKETDCRREAFEALHGEGCVELDALEAIYPGALHAELKRVIAEYRDGTLRGRLADAEDIARRTLSSVWRESSRTALARLATIREDVSVIVDDYRQRFADVQRRRDEALRAFAPRLAALTAEAIEAIEPMESEYESLVAALGDEIGPHGEQVADLWSEVEDLAAETVEETLLPARPEPVVDVDESEVLYDSRRHWWDQLQRYRQERGLGPIDHEVGYVGETAVCANPECGKTFLRRRKDKTTCERACADKVRRAERKAGGSGG